MKIQSDLLERFSSIQVGKIYYGALAKDESDHAAVIFYKTDKIVNYFCITSEERTVKFFRKKDPLAVVELDEELIKTVFKETAKPSWIYCGQSNLGYISYTDFIKKLSEGQITFETEMDKETFDKVITAIKNSKTFSKQQKQIWGIEKN